MVGWVNITVFQLQWDVQLPSEIPVSEDQNEHIPVPPTPQPYLCLDSKVYTEI